MTTWPSEYEADVVLHDGFVVQIRPIRPEDTAELRALFARMSTESIYQRFFHDKKELTEDEAAHYANVDYDDRMAFVVLHEGRILGVARYDRSAEEADTGEVAIAVEDAHQGRGIGTQLLLFLSLYARRRGIARLGGDVLPTNQRMMRIFGGTGLSLTQAEGSGRFRVELDTASSTSNGMRRAAEEREKLAISASLEPIFRPASIAIIGASRNPASISARLFHNLLSHDYVGPIYPVNPKAAVVHSVRAYASVQDIPDPVDLAFLTVPAVHVMPAVRDCIAKGVRGLVVITAGYSEVGPAGREREREMLEAVRGAGMRMVGPNCMGLLNTDPEIGMAGTFVPIFPRAGNVAMSSQSGALGAAILDYAHRQGIGISTFVSVGNRADISGNDLLLYWEDDPATDVILLYLESFGNPRRFGRIARRIAKKKPIVAVKSGRTAAGSRAASSHTGALASLEVAVGALFAQSGVIRTHTLEELFAVTQLLANQPVPAGRRVAVLTNAGGPGILAADALESAGLSLPEFSPQLQDRLRAVIAREASPRNPVDLIASGGPKEYGAALDALLTTDEVDAIIVIYVPPQPGGHGEIARAIKETVDRVGSTKTLLSVYMPTGAEPDPGRSDVTLEGGGHVIPNYVFPEMAAQALVRAARYGEWLRRPEGAVPVLPDVDPEGARAVVATALDRLGAEGGWLAGEEVSRLLSSFGVRVARSTACHTLAEALTAARSIGAPVALKVISPTALHKSDVGGVVLGAEGDEAVTAAWQHVTGAVDDAEGALVQEMVAGGIEVLVGMTEDPSFGPLIVYGLGGVFVELLGDVAFRIAPISDLDAHEMVREIHAAKLLEGYRGSRPGDVDAVEAILLRVSALIEAVPELAEMDLNPVKVLEPGAGAVVVDARIRVEPTTRAWLPELADIPSTARRPDNVD